MSGCVPCRPDRAGRTARSPGRGRSRCPWSAVEHDDALRRADVCLCLWRRSPIEQGQGAFHEQSLRRRYDRTGDSLRMQGVASGHALAPPASRAHRVQSGYPPPVTGEWKDTFDRDDIGGDYYKSGGGYDLTNGSLSARGAHNHPLWLRKRLPRDIGLISTAGPTRSEATSRSSCSVTVNPSFLDGGQYKATGYELVFGGWFNSKSIDRQARRARQGHRRGHPEEGRADAALPLADRAGWQEGHLVGRRHADAVLVSRRRRPARRSGTRVFRVQQLGDGYLVRQPRDHTARAKITGLGGPDGRDPSLWSSSANTR